MSCCVHVGFERRGERRGKKTLSYLLDSDCWKWKSWFGRVFVYVNRYSVTACKSVERRGDWNSRSNR
jgi:hypothetical protein